MIRRTACSLVALLLATSPGGAEVGPATDDGPRTLVLALDGVPMRVVERARERGAFRGWPRPVPLVSTFPSVTNVAFTAIFRPFDVAPAGGYEVQHFDYEQNGIVGGSPVGYGDRIFAWRDVFDVTGRTFGSKLAVYTAPRRKAWKEIDAAERAVFESSREIVLAHVGAVDALMHLRGDEPVVRFVVELSDRIEQLQRRHLEQRGATLRVVLLSDHGNGTAKVHSANGIRKKLRRAKLRVAHSLEHADDVIAATFGLVGYGALYLRPERAADAGNAVVRHKSVDVAAWLTGDTQMRVVGRGASATVRWEPRSGVRWLAYLPEEGDPLRLAPALEALQRTGQVDDRGYATEDAWFEASALGELPDAARRLIDALRGTYVKNAATVVFSLRPGFAWGWRSAHASSRLNGGRLEGTHGALDRESSLGFLLSDHPGFEQRVAVRADRALVPFLEERR